MEAGGERDALRREGPLQQGDVQAGDHDRPARGSDHTEGMVGGIAGVEGEVARAQARFVKANPNARAAAIIRSS